MCPKEFQQWLIRFFFFSVATAGDANVNQDADFCQNIDGENHHPRGGTQRYNRKCQGQNSRQRGYPAWPAASDLRRQAAGGRPHPVRLQHPEGVHPPPGAQAARWRQEAQEEELHHPNKTKHKKKKVKLAVLKFYKVDENLKPFLGFSSK